MDIKNQEKKIVQARVTELFGSRWNRAMDSNGQLKELSESIKEHGILQPLIVREIASPDIKEQPFLEIVAGHRRWKAAEMAGLKEVPCIIVTLSDQDAKVAQITENLMRKDLNPMEEAQAFATLKEGNAHTHQTIADMVGKDVKYVYRSLELLRLPQKAQGAIEKGILSGAHGHQLARVGPKQIDTLVVYATTPGWRGEFPTLQNLKDEIGRRVEKKLSAAPFPKDCEYAGKISCKGCPYNSANQDSLFDGAEDGFCTNNTCFAAKLKQFYKDLQTKGEQKWPALKFIGTASSAYGEGQTVKGYEVVEASDPKVKAAIKSDLTDEKPEFIEGYGFGILKPSNWGTLKVPRLVVLKKLPKGKTAAQGYQRDPDEDYHWQFRRDYVQDHGAEMRKAETKAQGLREQLDKAAEAAWKKNKKLIVEEYKKKGKKS